VLALRTSPPASCFADRLLAWSLTKGHGHGGVRGGGAAVFEGPAAGAPGRGQVQGHSLASLFFVPCRQLNELNAVIFLCAFNFTILDPQKGIPQLPYPVRSSGTSANSASVSRFFFLHWALFMHGLIGDQLAHAHARARQSRPVLRCSHFGSECRGRRKKCTGYS
jgi:hypothetical protein